MPLTRCKVHIGCSGWFYWHWKGLFYPADEPTHRWFKHYLARFKTVELNAPFYRWPQTSTVKTWARQASPRFKYCIKVNREITHERRMESTGELVRRFYDLVEPLGPKLGCLLFQFPPSYRFDADALARITDQLDPVFRNAIEFRHKSWWNEDVFRTFRERNLIFCSVSGPRLPDDLVRTADQIYVRFHGRDRWYRYNYSAAELEHWATRILSSGASRAWVYFNNDRDAHAIRNARTLQRLIRRNRAASSDGFLLPPSEERAY